MWESFLCQKEHFAFASACVCERLPLGVFLRVCQEVDCCGGGVRGCRAPNEGVRNKISALGSSSAHRLPQTPSD